MFDKYLKSTKSKIIVAIAIIFVMLFTFAAIASHENKKVKEWRPITQEINVEYGRSDAIDKKHFIRVNDDVEVISIDLDIPYVETDKMSESYYKLGTFDGILSVKVGRQEQEYSFKVIVRDTVAPRFTKYSERIVVPVGYSGSFKEFFEFEDVDDITVDIDTDSINPYVPAVYTSTVRAKDPSNNMTEKKFFVEVRANSIPEVPTEPVVPPTHPKEVVKSHKNIILYENIRYNIKRIADPELPVGQEVVETPGVLGKMEVNIRVFYEDDVEVRRETMSETIKEVPKDEIIRYGTKEEQKETEGAFKEFPVGLVEYETYVENGMIFGKEVYENVEDAIVRGEDLVRRKLITEYTQRSVTFGETKYYYILFTIDQ